MTPIADRAQIPPAAAADERRWWSLGVLVIAVLLLAIDGTVLALAVPALTRDLHPDATQVLWIGDIYSLALSGLLVVMGNLADRFGRKRVLLLGSAAFGLASIVCAFSVSPEMLIAGRFLLGVAGATLMPSTLSMIRGLFTDARERTIAISVWSAAFAGGEAIGPLVGGALLEHFWWGAVFLINVPVVAVILVAGGLLLRESRDPNPGAFDLLSAALSIVATTSLIFALKHLTTNGLDWQTALALLLALGTGWWFIARQRRLAAPLLDVTLFTRPAFSGAVVSNFVAVFALTGLLFFFSQYLQLVRGLSPIQAGLAELPAVIAAMAVIVLVAWFKGRLGVGRSIALGLVTTAAGLALVAVAEGAEPLVWLCLALLPIGLGVGLTQTLTTDAVMSTVPANKAGAASAVSETSYELGVVFGIAVLGSVLNLLYRTGLSLPDSLSEAERKAAEDSLASAMNALPDNAGVIEAAREAFTAAMQLTSIIAAGVTLVAALLAWRLIPSPTARRQGSSGVAQDAPAPTSDGAVPPGQ